MSMDVVWKCIGHGTFYVFRNGYLMAQLFNGEAKTVLYQIGDTIAFRAQPDSGYHVKSVCDFPQTECQTAENYSYTVTGQLPQMMIATFEINSAPPPPPPPADMPVVWKCMGPGTFYVFRNGDLMAQLMNGESATVSFKIGDTIVFRAQPDLNAHVKSVCDFPQTECQTLENYSFTVTGQLGQMMIATFEANTCVPNWQCSTRDIGIEYDGCGGARANVRCNAVPPPGDKKITLEVSKPPAGQLSFKPGDTITFTAITNLEEETKITLRERFSAYDLTSGNVSNGQVILTKSAGQPAQLAYYVFGGGILIPYESNTVTVYISEGGDMKPPLDWKQLAMYGIAGIGGAIVLSSILGRK